MGKETGIQVLPDIEGHALCSDAEAILAQAIEEHAVAAVEDGDGPFGIFKLRGKAIILATRDVLSGDNNVLLERGRWYIPATDSETVPFLQEMVDGATHIAAANTRWIALRRAGEKAYNGMPLYNQKEILSLADDAIATLPQKQLTAGKGDVTRRFYRDWYGERRFAGYFPR